MKSVPCLLSVVVLGAWAAIAPGCLSEDAFTDQMKCTTDAECDDGNPCTADTCAAGACQHAAANGGVACGAGLTCNGAGQCAACAKSADCGAATECVSFACVDQACKATYVAAGTALPDTTKGDCKSPQCDGHGDVVMVSDPNDVPTSSDACMIGSCTAQGPTEASAPVGTACSAGVCDSAGACVECNVATDCTSPSDAYCYDNECASCSDGEQDGDETGVDCGGSHCGKCGGQTCTAPSDCQTASCVVTASGGEVCGWPSGVACMFDSQCASMQCQSGACTAP